MDWTALAKRLGRTGGLACMIAGGLLCGMGVNDALNTCPDAGCEDATLAAAGYAATFCFGGMVHLWGKRP